MTRSGAALDRHPWLLVALLSGAAFLRSPAGPPVDAVLFEGAGHQLVTGHLSQVFASPLVQTGPLALLLLGIVGSTGALLVAVLCVLLVGGAVVAVRALLPVSAQRGWAAAAVGLLGVAVGRLDGSAAHPTYVLVPVLWVLAVRAAQGDRAVVAGVLVGLGCGLEAWGALGLCVLLLVRSRGAVAAAVVTAACWLPFAVAGGVRTGDYRWYSVAGSLPALLHGPGPTPWSYRVAQGAVVLTAGAVVALRLRRDPDLPWLLPVVLVLLRTALDPLQQDYYATPVVLLLAAGAAGLLVARRRPRLAVVALLGVVWAGTVTGPLLSAGPVLLGLAGVALLAG